MLRTSCTSYIRMARVPASFPGTIEDLCILFSCLTFGGLQAFADEEWSRVVTWNHGDVPASFLKMVQQLPASMNVMHKGRGHMLPPPVRGTWTKDTHQ